MDLLTAIVLCLGFLVLALTPLAVILVQWRNFWQVLDREDQQLAKLFEDLDHGPGDHGDGGEYHCPECDSADEDDWG